MRGSENNGNALHARTAPRSSPQRSRRHFEALRALRLLHRHLPDLSSARRRARKPEGPDLSHQVDARGEGGAEAGPPASRSLPVVQLLHDDMSERRRLHASVGLCTPADREIEHARSKRRVRGASFSAVFCLTRSDSGLRFSHWQRPGHSEDSSAAHDRRCFGRFSNWLRKAPSRSGFTHRRKR